MEDGRGERGGGGASFVCVDNALVGGFTSNLNMRVYFVFA